MVRGTHASARLTNHGDLTSVCLGTLAIFLFDGDAPNEDLAAAGVVRSLPR